MRIIKRYSNNRKMRCPVLKDYVTLVDIERFIKDNEDVQIIDSDTGLDITGQILLQVFANNPMNAQDIKKLIDLIKHK